MPQEQVHREVADAATGAPWVIVAIGRPTFDLVEAQRHVDAAVEVVSAAVPVHRAAPRILTEAVEVADAMAAAPSTVAGTVVLQATFADSRLAAAAADGRSPLVIWAFPERRTGEALRLNSLCGLNLASFRLRRADRHFGWLYADPTSDECPERFAEALRSARVGRRPETEAVPAGATLPPWRVGVVGDAPDGFEPCVVDEHEAPGPRYDRVPIDELFAVADAQDELDVVLRWEDWADRVVGLEELDAPAVERSIRLELALDELGSTRGWDGAAVRCWPECFDHYGCAACGAMGSLTASGTPTCCEADALGAATGVLLSDVAGTPGFVADLVDVDPTDGTAALWHCGTAPPTMADDRTGIRAIDHPYRHRPLLREFALRPGRVTFARLSRSGHRLRLVVGTGEILDRPRPYAGTSAVVRFAAPPDQVLDTVIGEGLEHHLGVVHGDVRAELERFAGEHDLPVLHLGR